MVTRKKSKVTRILAVVLAVMMVVYNLPVRAVTTDVTPESNTPEVFTLQVVDQGDPVSDIAVSGHNKDNEVVVAGTTNQDGVVEFPEITTASLGENTQFEFTIEGKTNPLVLNQGTKEFYIYDLSTEAFSLSVPEPEPAKETYQVSVTKTGSGKVAINSSEYSVPVSVEEGTDVEVKITPDPGYEIKNVTIGGEAKAVPDPASFIEMIKGIAADTGIEVEFAQITHTISFMPYQNGTIKGQDGQPVSFGGGNSTVLPGKDSSFSVIPQQGYHLDSIKIDGQAIDLAADPNGSLTDGVYTYTFTNVSENHTVEVLFAINTYTVTFHYNKDEGTVKDGKEETINSDGGTITVEHGSEPTIKVTPFTGYHIAAIAIDDKPLELPADVTESSKDHAFTLAKVTKDQKVEVTFAINIYKVTASVEGGHGQIAPAVSDVQHSGAVTVTITPEDNSYKLAWLTVNGNPVTDFIENNDGTTITYTYTVSNISGDTNIKAGFESIEVLKGGWEKYISFTPTAGKLIDSYTDQNKNTVLVYSKDAAVEITANEPYNQVDISNGWSESITINESTSINKLLVRAKGTGLFGNKRVRVDLPGKIIVVFDTESPSINPPELDGNDKANVGDFLWFSDTVTVTGEIENVGQTFNGIEYFTPIEKVYYSKVTDTPDAASEAQFDEVTNRYTFTTVGDHYQGQYKIWAVDKAGNISLERTFEINIDKNVPTLAEGQAVTIEKINDDNWSKIINFFTFGTFLNEGLEVTVKVKDDTSGIKDIQLKTSDEQVVPELVHDSFIKAGLTAQATFRIDDESFEGTLAVEVTDSVNNAKTYDVNKSNSNINPEGNGYFMIDRNAPSAEIKVIAKEGVHSYQDKYYSGDITYEIAAQDTDSGVNTVMIKVNEKEVVNEVFSTEKQTDPLSYKISTNDPEMPAEADGSYLLSEVVKDNAGNIQEAEREIIIDEQVPVLANGKAVHFEEINDGPVAGFLNFLTFGTFFNKAIMVTVEAKDLVSGMKSVTLDAIALNSKDKDIVPEKISEEFSEDGLTAKAAFRLDVENFEGKFAVEVTDNVNNRKSYEVTKANSNIHPEANGVFMVDRNAPTAEILVTAHEGVSLYKEESTGRDIYSGDVMYDFNIEDIQSGVNTVAILVNGKLYKEYDFSQEAEKQNRPVIEPINTEALSELGFPRAEEGSYDIQLKVTDNARNSIELGKTIFIDDLDPVLADGEAVTFVKKNENHFAKALNFLTFGTFFNQEIEVTVRVKDDLSGIKAFSLKAGQKDQADAEVVPQLVAGSFHNDGLTAEAKYTIDAEYFNGTLSVEVEDNVTNKSPNPYIISSANSNITAKDSGIVMIEKTLPSSKIAVVKEEDVSSNGDNQYNDDVTFDFDIEDTDSGVNAVRISVNEVVIDEYYFHEKEAAEQQPSINPIRTDDERVTIQEDGQFDVLVEVIDNAGNTSKAEKTIYIDKTAPIVTDFTFSTEGKESQTADEMNESVELTDYGFYFKKPVEVTVTAKDPVVVNEFTSKVKSMIVYLKDHENGKYYTVTEKGSLTEITEAGIGKIQPVPTTSNITFTIPASFKGQIFARAIDNVNNSGEFVTPDGTVIEDEKQHAKESHITFEKAKTKYKDNNDVELYAGNVNVNVTVTDTYSGLGEIEWSVSAPYDTTNNQQGRLKINNDKTFAEGSQVDGWKQTKTDHNLVTEMTKTFTVNHNSNNIVVKVKMTDRAGNTTEEKIYFSIDKTAPEIKVTYDNNSADAENADYFKADRTATIVITERNFKPSDVEYLITNTDGAIPALAGWSTAANSSDPDKTTHTATVKYTADGDYTFDISYKDNAENAAAAFPQQKFTLDKTIPVINVAYNNNTAANGNYYKASRTATISITEHNFDTSRITVTGTASDNGAPASFPGVSGWSTRGDVHTATISYGTDGKYSFDIEFTDMAGNVAADYTMDEFIVDQTAPELAISGVADMSANNGDVIPVIAYSDTNFNKNAVSINLTGANRGPVNRVGGYSDASNGQVYTFKNFEKTKVNDDLYTLTATLTDFAGNVTTETVRFSVNRFGSVYVFDEKLKAIDGKYVQNETDVIVTETNVDSLKPETIKVKMTKNGTPSDLVEGTDYTVTETGGAGQWSQYTYVVGKKQFTGDGRYTVAFYSEDAAGNVNENIDETKKAEISFGIDKTAPVIVPIDIESGEQYPVENKSVTVSIKDNLVLEGATVYLNNKEVEHKANGENYTFDIGSSNEKQHVKIVAVDAAGNELSREVEDFLVSTNPIVRWYNNTPLFAGSLGGVGGLGIAVAAYFIFRNQRKAEVDDNQAVGG
nr:hypothetical protein [Neobacillus sp. Marseille-Q6967]